MPSLEKTIKLLVPMGWIFISVAVIVNIRTVELLFVTDQELEWPNTFYIYSAQMLSFAAGIFLLITYAYRHRIHAYLHDTPLKTLSVHFFFLLVLVDVLLQVFFALTVSHPGDGDLGLFYRLFHLDWEKNVPSTYSAIKLIIAGYAAGCCMQADKKSSIGKMPIRYIWLIVATLLILMGIDEYFSFHEDAELILVKLKIISPDYDNTLGGYGYAWTIVGMSFAVIIGLPAIFLFLKIFSKYKYLFYLLLISGFVFLWGAVGMENLQVYLRFFHPDLTATGVLMLEEFFEMMGVSLAIFVFVRYIGEEKQQCAG
jgi:hypothetical protein